MPNNYFQFKQFIIQQENCAMKVCTDACIFGAYIANEIKTSSIKIENILDIGTGTGLISLMLAQETTAKIDAVEIDAAAALQAKENFENSPWANRLQIFNTDILKFNADKKYDCIISNPPFFEDDLKSDDEAKNFAKHDNALTLTQLLAVINNHLSQDGIFAMLLPFHRMEYFIKKSAVFNFHLNQNLLIKHNAAHNYFRSILIFSKNKSELKTNELIIKDEKNVYTLALVQLLRNYYLHL